ncbi:hypothetical protein KSS87_019059, partial [Heliosperma pusillum]
MYIYKINQDSKKYNLAATMIYRYIWLNKINSFKLKI